MIYTYKSCEPVIAEFLAKTKMTDSNYADDLLVWLREGMNLMRVRNVLKPSVAVIEVNNQVGKLPCGLVTLDGFYYNGKRLRKGTGVIDTRICKDKDKVARDYQSYFVSDPTDEGYINMQDYRLVRGLDIKQASEDGSNGDYYIPYPNHIQTTFREGKVVCFFRKMPTDDKGYPLIPDEENVRQALFWWLMAQVTLSGFKHADARMNYDYCEAKFGHYAKVGKRILKYWSVDTRQSVLELTCNLIPPHGYYDKFFNHGEQPKYVNL